MPERPDLYPPSCVHQDACQCSVEESTRLVEVEIPVFVVKHNGTTAELPTGAQARGWLSDMHREETALLAAAPEPVDTGEAAPDVTVSDIEGAPA